MYPPLSCVLQGAAKLASSLVSTVWGVLDDLVVTPALHEYAVSGGGSRGNSGGGARL